jgi:hypothetical protein
VGQHVIQVRGLTPASRPAVWRVLADSSGWKEWGIYSDVHRERDGNLTPEGVGRVAEGLDGRSRVGPGMRGG